MKLLLNMNMPRQLGRQLAKRGHEWRHVADIDMAAASDVAIVDEAEAHGEVILTHDLDYGRLLAFRSTSTPSVIIFRMRNASLGELLVRLDACWPRVSSALERGASW